MLKSRVSPSLAAALLAVVFATAARAADPAKLDDSSDPTEGNIAKLTGRILEKSHYTRRPFDEEVSRKFFDRYIDSLDYSHMMFLESDVKEFEVYRDKLGEMTLRLGDTSPAHLIFARYLVRLKQQTEFVNGLLQTNAFEFTGDDRYTPDRHTSPRPKDMAEARELWRQRLRHEYLQDKMAAGIVHLGGVLSSAPGGGWVIRSEDPKPDAVRVAPGRLNGAKGEEIGAIDLEIQPVTNIVLRLHQTNAPASLTIKRAGLTNGVYSVALAVGKINWIQQTTGPVKDADGRDLGTMTNEVERLTNVVLRLRQPVAPFGLATEKLFDTNGVLRATATFSGTNYAWIDLENQDPEKIVKTLRNHYNRLAREESQFAKDDVLAIYLNALAHVYDPHTDYMGRREYEDFAMQMKLSLFGIGALLEATDEGYCKIKELMPGPAKRSSQVHVGDRIVGVGQRDGEMVDVVGMRLPNIVQMIRGPKGTVVNLSILRGEETGDIAPKAVTLVRDEIKLEDKAAKARLIEIPVSDNKVARLGVIDLSSFYADISVNGSPSSDPKSTTADVAKLLAKLNKEKVDGVILDLRRNGGGSLEEAINLSGLFIKEGPIVQVKDMNGDTQVEKDRDPSVLYGGPLVVLTSRFSASASEILAGALQDYDRALIVGDSSTHGKGTVQTLVELAHFMDQYHWEHSYNPGVVKLTIKMFFRPSGASTQLIGVAPDVILPSVNNYAKVGEKALDDALQPDRVEPANYTKVDEVKAYVTELRKLESERVEHEQDFVYVKEDIEAYKKLLADKSLSLNEEARRKEKFDLEARLEARRHEERSRPPSSHRVYDLTLANVGEPGLPEPLPRGNPFSARSSATGDDDDDAIISVSGGRRQSRFVIKDTAGQVVPSTIEPAGFDPELEETERVLMDYINALRASGRLITMTGSEAR
jgi:carboxyl-terminal processing protease